MTSARTTKPIRISAASGIPRSAFTIATETWDAARSVFVVLRFGDETGVGRRPRLEA